MALPIRRLNLNRRSALVGLLLILAALVVPASSVLADEPAVDPAVYQPDGVGNLFTTPDMRQGHAPTLFEAYPDGAWTTDWKSRGWTHAVDNAVDPVLNGITNVLLGGTKAVTRAAIGFSYQMANFDAFGLLSNDITGMVRAVATTAIDWLLPTCLAIGAVLVLAKLGIGTGEGLRQFGALVIAGVIGTSLAVTPDLWTETMTAMRQAGAETTAKAAEKAIKDLDTPFAGPTPTWGTDETVNAQRRQADAIWRTYVAMPWCIAEFGSLRTCQDYGEAILSRTGGDRTEYIDSLAFKVAMGGDDSDAWKMITGKDGATRLAIMLPALLVACIFSGLVIFLNAVVLLYSLLALMLLVVGVFFALLWVIPGRPRQWGLAWVEKLFGFVFMSFIANLILMVTMLVAMTTMRLTGDYGWGVSALMTIIASIASLLLFRHVREILGVGSTGLMSMIGTGAAMSMVSRRFRPRRPGRQAPDTSRTMPLETDTGGNPNSAPTTGAASRPHRGPDRPQPHKPNGSTRPNQRRRANAPGSETETINVSSPRLTNGPADKTRTATAPHRKTRTGTKPATVATSTGAANAPRPGLVTPMRRTAETGQAQQGVPEVAQDTRTPSLPVPATADLSTNRPRRRSQSHLNKSKNQNASTASKTRAVSSTQRRDLPGMSRPHRHRVISFRRKNHDDR